MHLKPSLDLLTLTHFISLTAKPQTNLGGVVWGHIAQYTQLVSHLNRVLKIVSINSVRNISQLNFQEKSVLYQFDIESHTEVNQANLSWSF